MISPKWCVRRQEDMQSPFEVLEVKVVALGACKWSCAGEMSTVPRCLPVLRERLARCGLFPELLLEICGCVVLLISG